MEIWSIALLSVFGIMFAIGIFSLGIFLWMKGLRENNVLFALIGAFICLNWLGVIIAILQLKPWEKKDTFY